MVSCFKDNVEETNTCFSYLLKEQEGFPIEEIMEWWGWFLDFEFWNRWFISGILLGCFLFVEWIPFESGLGLEIGGENIGGFEYYLYHPILKTKMLCPLTITNPLLCVFSFVNWFHRLLQID